MKYEASSCSEVVKLAISFIFLVNTKVIKTVIAYPMNVETFRFVDKID